MILWYYKIWPNVVWKVEHGLMDTITRTKTKNITVMKKKSPLFFPCSVSLQQKHVIPRPVIAAILHVILNILQR